MNEIILVNEDAIFKVHSKNFIQKRGKLLLFLGCFVNECENCDCIISLIR